MARLTLITARNQDQTLELALDAFLLDAQARHLTPKTIAYYRHELGRFIAYCTGQGITTLPALSADPIRRYLVDLQQRGLKGTSQHTAARAVRAWCTWCVKEELIPVSPMRHITMPKQERDILPALSVADVGELLEAAGSARDRAIILCLLDSGCRASEFCALDLADYDRKTGEVRVMGKGRKGRITFFGPRARAELARYLYSRGRLPGAAPLFAADRAGRRLTVSGLLQILRRIGRRAGVHVSPHALRRTCALWCHRAGWRLTEIQQLLGHADLTVLRRYLDLDDSDLRAAHASKPPSGQL